MTCSVGSCNDVVDGVQRKCSGQSTLDRHGFLCTYATHRIMIWKTVLSLLLLVLLLSLLFLLLQFVFAVSLLFLLLLLLLVTACY